MLTSEVRKHYNEMWRKRWVVLTLTGDVTVLKIIKPIMTATKHDDTHATDPRPCSPFSTAQMKLSLSSSVLQCANQNVKSITLQASGKSRQMKFSTHTVSVPWWVLVSPAGDTWRGGSDSSLTDKQDRELKRMSTQTLYSHLCSISIHDQKGLLSVWTRKTFSNGAFDAILWLSLCHIFQSPDYFNGKLGNELLSLAIVRNHGNTLL